MRTPFLVLSAAALLFPACTLNTDYFSEYRGKNLLENYDFDATNPDTTAKWVTTTVGLNASVATNDHYMTWAQATDLNTTGDATVTRLDVGPDGVSPAYRLEIKNLIPDGDFEAEGEVLLGDGATVLAGTPAFNGWASYNGDPKYGFSNAHADSGQPTPIPFVPPLTIGHRSLLYSSQAVGETLGLSLNTALGSWTESLWQPGQYRIRFDFVNVAGGQALGYRLFDGLGNPVSNLDVDNGGAWTETSLNPGTDPALRSASKTFRVSTVADTLRLVIGASSGTATDAAIMDNVRIVPAEIALAAKTTFPSLNSGALKLLPGTKSGAYVFTIWVHDDPTADQNGASGVPPLAHALNRFYPSGLTVEITGKAKGSGEPYLVREFKERESSWASWTKITLAGGLDFVDRDADLDGSNALTITLTPTNAVDISTEGKDVGSLLVSQPSLTFNP